MTYDSKAQDFIDDDAKLKPDPVEHPHDDSSDDGNGNRDGSDHSSGNEYDDNGYDDEEDDDDMNWD